MVGLVRTVGVVPAVIVLFTCVAAAVQLGTALPN